MLRKMHVVLLLIFSLLSLHTTQQFQDGNDDCSLQTAIVLHKLKSCGKERCDGLVERIELLTEALRETISTTLRQQQEENKSQFERIRKKLEKMDGNKGAAVEVEAQVENVQELSACEKCERMKGAIGTNFFSTLNRLFHFNTTHALSWIESKEYCEQRGMQMAAPKTLEQLQRVAQQLQQRAISLSLWVWASDVGRTPGHLHWADGTPVDSGTWQSRRPSGGARAGQDTCVAVNSADAKLYFFKCFITQHTLCEAPAALSKCMLV